MVSYTQSPKPPIQTANSRQTDFALVFHPSPQSKDLRAVRLSALILSLSSLGLAVVATIRRLTWQAKCVGAKCAKKATQMSNKPQESLKAVCCYRALQVCVCVTIGGCQEPLCLHFSHQANRPDLTF